MKNKNNPNDLDYREISSPVKDNSIFNRSSIKIGVRLDVGFVVT